MRLIHLISIFMAAAPVAAEPFLGLPIDCTLGQTCVIEDYKDADPGPNQRDYTCGIKARDGHSGTDFALLSFDAMREGVDILAAADGVVSATRDGMADTPYTPENAEEIEGRECGNAIRIDHANGYQTLYCHLERGSLLVRSKHQVTQGDVIARVGLSGQTNYPHLHFTLLKDGKRIDPFAPEADGACGEAGKALWLDPIPYTRTGLFTAGFSLGIPSFDAVRSGAARAQTASTKDALVTYAYVFFGEIGDVLEVQAVGPGGEIYNEQIVLDKSQARLFRAFGRRAPSSGWAVGSYRAHVTLRRDGEVLAVRHADIVVR